MTEAIFRNSQEVEILTDRSMWLSCKSKQLIFKDFSPRYTIPFINGKLIEIDIVEALPSEAQRQLAESTALVQLKLINSDNCTLWQTLKRYIAKAYSPALQQANWNAAGMASYEQAYDENWESSTKLMRLANQFITDNAAALTLNLNMPPAFQATFADAKIAFDEKLQEFKTAEQTNTEGAETLVVALNTMHSDAIEMALDGQEIFKKEEGIVKQFIYDQVAKLYAGNGNQGYQGIITDKISGLPIKGAITSVEGTSHKNTSNAAGNFAMKNVAHATDQTLNTTADGYQPSAIPGNSVTIGKMTTVNIQLTPNP